MVKRGRLPCPKQHNPASIPVLAACISTLRSHHALCSRHGEPIHTLPAQQAHSPLGLQPSVLTTFTESSVRRYAHERIAYMYGEHAYEQKELKSYTQTEGDRTPSSGISGNACALHTCASLEQVQLLHHFIIDCGLANDVYCESLLVDLYVELESLENGVQQFEQLAEPDIFSWNIMISGYVSHDCFTEALQCYQRMYCAGFTPNEATYRHVLDGCTHLGTLEEGRLVHVNMIQEDGDSHPDIKEALINMYAKSGALVDALKLFNELHQHSATSWSMLIGGYAECGQVHEAFDLFKQMEEEGVQPNHVTYTNMLQACCYSVADSEVGWPIHLKIVKQGFDSVEMVGISLLDMYASCGKLEEAEHLFHRFSKHSSMSWSVMIAGFAQHGNGLAALKYFELMKAQNIRPNDASFGDILCACSNAGLTEVGSMFFKSMIGEFGISPSMEHCICMVDLLGRTGCLKEAEDVILQMPHAVADAMLVVLLGICNKYNNVEVGERAFAHFLRCESKIGAGYKLMASIYAANLMGERAVQVHKMRTDH